MTFVDANIQPIFAGQLNKKSLKLNGRVPRIVVGDVAVDS